MYEISYSLRAEAAVMPLFQKGLRILCDELAMNGNYHVSFFTAACVIDMASSDADGSNDSMHGSPASCVRMPGCFQARGARCPAPPTGDTDKNHGSAIGLQVAIQLAVHVQDDFFLFDSEPDLPDTLGMQAFLHARDVAQIPARDQQHLQQSREAESTPTVINISSVARRQNP